MASARERRLMEELMRDPTFRDAWEGLRGTVATLDRDSLDDPTPFVAAVRAATGHVETVLADRPKLAALVEAAESEEH